MQTQEQIENLQAIQLDVEIVNLDSPFTIGGQEIKSVEVRKPSVIALRKVRIADILNGDVNSICTLLPLCTSPTLTKQQLDTLVDPVDIIQMGGAIITFLQPKSVRAEIALQQ
ncbi:phage tail assembly protein [Acinetobacter sp. FDAARGOS_515]|uniref:phage tail assembly protein n=1 Tax=Acinetobacter sp. FDAARGOS_515 TaxID=2420307 RepID=UPI000F684510|nr:phage tail assembly protein [Acinetobacter sp. FDAARGOS_515]RSC23020.1 phage tail assembly protein [Acinetobacter sp. FDAARGOS_515]